MDLPKLATNLGQLVEFGQNWEPGCRLFVDKHNWGKIQPYYRELSILLGEKIRYVALGHPFEPRDGIRFGSTDTDVENLMVDAIGPIVSLDSEADASREADGQPDDFSPSSTWRRPIGRPRSKAEYPFHKLKNAGDCFLVTGNFNPGTLRVLASQRSTAYDKKFACIAVPAGILVILTAGHDVKYDTVVEV